MIEKIGWFLWWFSMLLLSLGFLDLACRLLRSHPKDLFNSFPSTVPYAKPVEKEINSQQDKKDN
ncbi:MAG: hypothetical protein HY606_14390 [Planctomycetes bacterium]|nr:hypothetical protein [Planctomycetota bacterium]